ncbi:MAG: hypothetical protein KGN00_12890, partial [Chloroflexota bacterium]|nr:hypothetical protein [Chloroflexota bacterium]
MSENDRELEALAQDLARFRGVAAPSGLRTRVRAEIMAAPVAPLAPKGARWLGALRPLLAGVLVVAVLAAGAGSAAAGSLPGDPAFPLKRAVENVQVALAANDAARLDLLTDQLDRRLTELETVATRHPSSVAVAMSEYEGALARVETEMAVVAREPESAGRDAAIARATAAAQEQIARLRALEATLPAAARSGIERAIEAQQRIESGRPGTPGGPGSAPNATREPSHPSGAP